MKITKPSRRMSRRSPTILLSDPGRTPPVAIIDTREQTPLILPGLRTVTRGLVSGDYSLVGAEHLFAIERKSLNDLVGCVTRERERFERELIRLRGYRFRRLLIVGTEDELANGDYTSTTPPAAVMASLITWEVRFDVPVVFCDDAEVAGGMVEAWIRAFAKELAKDAGNAIAGIPDATPARIPVGERQEA